MVRFYKACVSRDSKPYLACTNLGTGYSWHSYIPIVNKGVSIPIVKTVLPQ